MKRLAVVCVVTAFALISAPTRAALVMLDQYQESWNTSCDVGGNTMMAQTFTAGLTGILDHIEIGTPDFGFSAESTPVVTLYEGHPDGGSFLTSFTLSDGGRDEGFDNYRVLGDPTANIEVKADLMYSILLTTGSTWTAWVGALAAPRVDPYTDGALWAYDEGTWKLYTEGSPSIYDMQFRTYVVAVPLPAGISLGICAVSLAGWHLKRQKR